MFDELRIASATRDARARTERYVAVIGGTPWAFKVVEYDVVDGCATTKSRTLSEEGLNADQVVRFLNNL